MKTKVILTAGLILGSTLFGYSDNGANNIASNTSITVFATEQTQALVSVWAENYNMQDGPSIEVLDFDKSFKGQSHLLNEQMIIAKESEMAQIQGENDRKMVIGRDIVVPLITTRNPHFAAMMEQGISVDLLKKAMENPATLSWGILMGNSSAQKVAMYRINDAGTQDILANLFNQGVVSEMIAVNGTEELMQKLSKEPAALGFCRLADLVAAEQTSFPEGIALLPFDFNQNGKLEQIENIYTSPDAFIRGVWIGKYPDGLYQNLYAVSAGNSYSQSQRAFLKVSA